MLRKCSFLGLTVVSAAVLGAFPAGVCGGQTLHRYLTHSGVQRHYILYVPSGYTSGNSTPLVVNIHGGGSSGATQVELCGMNAVAEREGFLVAYPDAINGAWLGPDHQTDPYDDIGFIPSMIGQVSSAYSVDATRVYATGLSLGGVMSYILSVEWSYTFAAIASVGGVRAYAPGTTVYAPVDVPPTPIRPFPLLHVHGTADAMLPYNGGYSYGWWWPPCEQVVGEYVANNGCDGAPSVTDLPDIDLADGCAWKPPDPPCLQSSYVQVLTYGNCSTYLDRAGNARQAEVLFYRVLNGGHSWPGSDWLGWETWHMPVNQDIEANEEIWSFFKRHAVATAWADFDADLDVDASDLEIFEACATGPGIAYDSAALPTGCTLLPDSQGFIAADLDRDLDVDQSDFGRFQRCYSGEGQRPDSNCAS